MNNLFSFGLITGLMILFAFLADLLIVSALISLLHPKNRRNQTRKFESLSNFIIKLVIPNYFQK